MLAALADAPAEIPAWLRRAIASALAALQAIGALIFVRRLLDAFTTPLPTAQLLALVAVAGMISIGSRLLWRRLDELANSPDSRWLDRFVGLGGTAAIVLLALGSCYPAGRVAPWLLWLALLIADQVSAHAYFQTTRQRRPSVRAVAQQPSPAVECLLQQLVRTRDLAGVETIRATLRADFVPGQRHATLHVGFCPPLAALPDVAAEPADGPDASVKVVQAFAHGARLEVRLATAAQAPCHVLIDLAAAPLPPPMAPSSPAPI